MGAPCNRDQEAALILLPLSSQAASWRDQNKGGFETPCSQVQVGKALSQFFPST